MNTTTPWNPATGVNDIKEMRVVHGNPESFDETEFVDFFHEHVPHLCDEVERLRGEVQELAKSELRRQLDILLSDHSPSRRWFPKMEFGLFKGIERTWPGLKKLSEKSGGWWTVIGNSPTFIPLSQWLPLYEAWRKEQEKTT